MLERKIKQCKGVQSDEWVLFWIEGSGKASDQVTFEPTLRNKEWTVGKVKFVWSLLQLATLHSFLICLIIFFPSSSHWSLIVPR